MNFCNNLTQTEGKARWKYVAPSRATCQIWEARARGVRGRFFKRKGSWSVAREGKRKFEFLGVTDAEGRKHRGNPTGECRYEFQKRERAGRWKPIKCILYTYTAAASLRLCLISSLHRVRLCMYVLCVLCVCVVCTDTSLYLVCRCLITFYSTTIDPYQWASTPTLEVGSKNQSMQKRTKTCAMGKEKRSLQIHIYVREAIMHYKA